MAGSDALLASQINGGGCLPPPTPLERPGESLSRTIQQFFGTEKKTAFAKYANDLPAGLAFRSSTKKQMVEGVGGYIDPDNMRMPEDPSQMGVTIRRGVIVRVERPRRTGGSMWETSSMAASAYHHQPGGLDASLL